MSGSDSGLTSSDPGHDMHDNPAHEGYTMSTNVCLQVFIHIHFSTSSSAWVFAYHLPPAANPLEESAREQCVVGAN